MTNEPAVSVILCTYNPDLRLLTEAIDSVVDQSVSTEYEVIVVDNNSDPPLDVKLFDRWPRQIKSVREPEQGLIHARVRGIKEARGQLLVFVDDDNRLASDYLAQAQSIADSHPDIGALGGVVDPADPLDWIPKWKRSHLSHLAIRDNGPDPITSFEMRTGPWDPVGAGMVVRRAVAERFVSLIEDGGHAAGLGRSGTSLLAQEDTLLARCANLEGYACSYQPALRLLHHIKEERLDMRYLCRLTEGLGKSYVKLGRVLELPLKPVPTGLLGRMRLLAIYVYLTLSRGRSGFVKAYWHKGYLAEYSAE